MAVRSQRLVAANVVIAAGTNALVYTVPAGFHTIIRSVFIYNRGTGTVTVIERVDPAGAAPAILVNPLTIASAASAFVEVWRVLEEGDQYYLRCAVAADVNVWMSGAELAI
jgi:hypothetical protein